MERRAGGNLAGRLGAALVAGVGVGRDARRGRRLQRHRRSRSRRAGGAHATAARGVGPGGGVRGKGVAYYAVSCRACRASATAVDRPGTCSGVASAVGRGAGREVVVSYVYISGGRGTINK